jgi:hypothetical protein
MVNLSLTNPLLPQKPTCSCGLPGVHLVGKEWYCTECFINGDDERQEEAYEHIRFSYRVRYNFPNYLRRNLLHVQRRLGVTR